MTSTRPIRLALFSVLFSAAGFAAKPIPGPGGGRILTTEAPHAEFLVQQDRTVAVRFYNGKLEPLPPAGQVVTAVAEAKSGKVPLTFDQTATGFVSRRALPAGDEFIVVVQIREAAGARPKNYRVLFHDETCGDCKRAEYACTCENSPHDQHHQHAPKKK